MKHVHLNECLSTQDEIKNLIKDKNESLLVSTDYQKAGVGRRGNQWINFDHALAFSFTLKPCEELTLTSLEIGALLCQYFKTNLKLKWPNDLINDRREKVGGIICQVHHQDLVIVGIGINLFVTQSENQSQFKLPPGGIFNESPTEDHFKKNIPLNIYSFIQKNRLNKNEIISIWNKHCCHLNEDVTIEDGDQKVSGIFTGIDKIGAAQMRIDEELKSVISGSLFFNQP